MADGSYGVRETLLRAIARFVLKISGPRSKTITRSVAISALLILTVLGLFGFANYRPEGEDTADPPTVVYRVLSLFVFNTGGEPNVPWLIDLTRITAPFVLGFSTALLGLTFANRWARRELARTARSHDVLVGPWLRISHHVPASESDVDLEVVHVVDDPAQLDACSTGHLHALIGPTWIREVQALRARRVVISAGRDLQSVTLLDDLLAAAPVPVPQVEVEIDDHPTGVQLAVTLAHDHPDADVDVVDSTVVAATTLANLIAPPLPGLDQPAMPAPPTYLVVATAAHHDFLLGVLIEHLERQADQSQSTVQRLCVIDPTPSVSPALELTRSGAVSVERFTSVRGFIDAHGREDNVRAAVLAGPDKLELATTVEVLVGLPDAQVWVDEAIRVPSPRVKYLTPGVDSRSGYWSAAIALIDDVMGAADDPELSVTLQRADIRAAMAELTEHCEISPARLATKATTTAGDAMVALADKWIISALGTKLEHEIDAARALGIDDPEGRSGPELRARIREQLLEQQARADTREERDRATSALNEHDQLVERMARLRLLPYCLAFLGIIVHEPTLN